MRKERHVFGSPSRRPVKLGLDLIWFRCIEEVIAERVPLDLHLSHFRLTEFLFEGIQCSAMSGVLCYSGAEI